MYSICALLVVSCYDFIPGCAHHYDPLEVPRQRINVLHVVRLLILIILQWKGRHVEEDERRLCRVLGDLFIQSRSLVNFLDNGCPWTGCIVRPSAGIAPRYIIRCHGGVGSVGRSNARLSSSFHRDIDVFDILL